VVAALAAASLLFAKPAHADTFTVTNSNDGVGIVVADGNKVQGNLIGTQKDATSPLSNSGERVA
jgi:hypothetical protein